MRTRPGLPDAVVGLLLLGVWSGIGAEETLKVVKLRTEKVGLFDCKDSTKKSEFSKKEFREPWPVLSTSSVTPPSGFLQVVVGGEHYCVRAYTVETNKPIPASAECGALVAVDQPKSAATRGLGKECKP
jgi:hypothetical protein